MYFSSWCFNGHVEFIAKYTQDRVGQIGVKFMCNKPCKTCPWRKSSKVGGESIPHFDMELMRALTNTVPPRGSGNDGFFSVMACHSFKVQDSVPCKGYVASVGSLNINVRLMSAKGQLDFFAIVKESADIELYQDFYTMLDDYEEFHLQKN